MDAIVPAAGEGTRLRPLTDDRPKPLVEVAGRPLLAHVFDALAPADPDRFVVVTGYRGDAIREHVGESYRDTPVTYVRQERRLGLAHAVATAAAVVDGSALLCNGDNVLGDSLAGLWDAHRCRAAERDDYVATMLVEDAAIERAREVGAVVTDGRAAAARDGEAPGTAPTGDGAPYATVRRVVEKADDPPSTLVSAGAYAFEQPLFDACRQIDPAPTGEYELADAITWLVDRGYEVGTRRYGGERVNVNEPDDVERAAALATEH